MNAIARARRAGYVPFLGKTIGRWMRPTDEVLIVDGRRKRTWQCSRDFRITDDDSDMAAAAAELLEDAHGHQ